MLDKSKPYGEVFGPLVDGIKFIQGGKNYNTKGEEVGAPKKTRTTRKRKAKKVTPKVNEISNEELERFMSQLPTDKIVKD